MKNGTRNEYVGFITVVARDSRRRNETIKLQDRADVFGWSIRGEIVSRKGQEVVMKNARRIWYWAGAASLSQLAMQGTSKPNECKFPCEVTRVELLDVKEILDTTEVAEKSIKAVPEWKQ